MLILTRKSGQKLRFITESGEEITITLSGATVKCAIDAPKSIKVLRGELSPAEMAIPERQVFTIREVANICKVTPRAVSGWFDSGRLKGYRIPGSQDRRVPREYLIKFLRDNHMEHLTGV